MLNFLQFAPETEYAVISRSGYVKTRFMFTHGIPYAVNLPFRFRMDDDIIMELDKEYYDDQVELKVRAMPYNKTNLELARNAIKYFANDTMVGLVGDAPRFVGTHLHFWTEGDKPPLLKLRGVLFILEYFINWFEKQLLIPNPMMKSLMYFEIQRMIFNHNIWHYFDIEFLDSKMVELMNRSFNQGYAFMRGGDRPKYQPIVFSPANDSGKPETVEVRAIPNTWYLLASKDELFEFTDGFNKAINSRTSGGSLKQSILIARLRLMSLYRYLTETLPIDLKRTQVTRGILSTCSNHYGFPDLQMPNILTIKGAPYYPDDPHIGYGTLGMNQMPGDIVLHTYIDMATLSIAIGHSYTIEVDDDTSNSDDDSNDDSDDIYDDDDNDDNDDDYTDDDIINHDQSNNHDDNTNPIRIDRISVENTSANTATLQEHMRSTREMLDTMPSNPLDFREWIRSTNETLDASMLDSSAMTGLDINSSNDYTNSQLAQSFAIAIDSIRGFPLTTIGVDGSQGERIDSLTHELGGIDRPF